MIAFATWSGAAQTTADDELLVEALTQYGVACEAHPWDAAVDWTSYRAVLIRSTWDFHRRLDEFTRWIDRLDRASVPLMNPAALLRWNASKHYLKALAARHVRIVPTTWVEPTTDQEPPDLAAVLVDNGWESGAVVKPAVSASAANTFRVTLADAPAFQATFAAILAQAPRGVMVQPFVPEVLVHGEWSLLFFGGRYSHAVLKTPALGDFRVQRDFGGDATRAEPSASLILDATRVLHAAADLIGVSAHEIVYARIDGVNRAGRLLLMEFEGIEPVLFFRHDEAAALRMARCVDQALGH